MVVDGGIEIVLKSGWTEAYGRTEAGVCFIKLLLADGIPCANWFDIR
jgi:hypothetical protein